MGIEITRGVKEHYKLPSTYRLGSPGVGSFLEPPNHPRYETQSIFTQYGNYPPASQPRLYYRGRGFSDIEEIDKLFKPLPYDDPKVKLWEEDLYAYFATCYSRDGKTRNVSESDCGIKPSQRPETYHLAYLAVKERYPDAKPRTNLIRNPPDWGERRSDIYGKGE